MYMDWRPEINYSNVILAIHGYNDYSNAFKIPGQYLSNNKIHLISFDLRGFGRNNNKGNWFDLKYIIRILFLTLKK